MGFPPLLPYNLAIMAVAPGASLGPYEIISSLGVGGMGEVYKARDTRLDRTVAVKVLPPHLASDPTFRQRFEREARAVSSLNHPHICTLYDVGQQDGIDFLVMEYLEGETLAQRLQRGPLPLDQVLKYGIQIADAIDKAHRQGVVHRDLKPGNVMLTATSAKLLDFGLAKSGAVIATGSSVTFTPTQSSPITQHGTIVGTFQYMSPEQVEGREVDARSDIFAFGAVLYEMISGRRAFQGKSALSVASAILEKDPEPVSLVAPLTPPALDRTIRKCLQKDPEERWQSARDLLLELKWVAESGSQAGVPAIVSARRRLHERAWMAAAILFLMASLALGSLYYRNVTQEKPVIRASVVLPPKATFHMVGGPDPGPVAVSPDGTKLVFSAQSSVGEQALYLRPVNSSVSSQIAGTAGGSMPFWSPDSRRIGFFAEGKLKQIEASGGPPLTICEAGLVPRGGSWSQQGVIIFTGGPGHPLLRVPESGGTPAPVTELDEKLGETSHRWPQFLPDGKHFLYFARAGSAGTTNDNNGIRIGSLDGGTPKLLLRTQTNAAYASGYLLYLRDATLLAQRFNPDSHTLEGEAVPITEQIQRDVASSLGVFSASQTGVLAFQTGSAIVGSQLQWFDRNGKQESGLGEQAYHLDFSVSPDRKTVAASLVDPNGGPPDIWMYDITRLGLRTRFTFESSPERAPIWAPDSARIVFSSIKKARWDLYIKSFAGSGTEELLFASDNEKFPNDWSADGRLILFQMNTSGNRNDIWALPMTGDRKPFPVVQSTFNEMEAVFSTDGRWIAYSSDESGKPEIYVTPFPGPGRKWQISTNGGSRPRWSRNGKEIFYLALGDRIMSTEVSASGANFVVGRTKPYFEIRAMRPGTIFTVAGDGQRFLVNTALQTLSGEPMTLMVNWPSGLRKNTHN
ncbi:MAG: protein kinase [Terriglobales bacterium]